MTRGIEKLEAAFAARDISGARIGVFGNGLPEALVSATGARVADVTAAPDAELRVEVAAIQPMLEPFLDPHVRLFLHRLCAGRFSHLGAIVFCRDDSPALVAYQYALELVRQGLTPMPAPRLLLWNLVHAPHPAARRFNLAQVARLWSDLAAAGFPEPAPGALDAACAAERRRAHALARLESMRKDDSPRVSGGEAMRWRNAGRYLPADEHAGALHEACDAVGSRDPRIGVRIGLVGQLLDCVETYAAIERIGTIVCDLQPMGEAWPVPSGNLPDPATIVAAVAADARCPRIHPPQRFVNSMVDACAAARCDLVVSQVGQNDDSFGWDVPGLRRLLEERGIAFADLGFRSHRPDRAWIEDAAARIAREVRQ